jgi:hypothetical protein
MPFQPSLILWVRSGAFPRMEDLKGASLTQVGFDLTCKDWTELKRLPRDKHSNLLQTLISYGCKTFYNTLRRSMSKK